MKSPDEQNAEKRLIEKSYTMHEAAAQMSWKYDMTYRHFRNNPNIMVRYEPKRFKRPKRYYRIPESVLLEEYKKLTSANQKAGELRLQPSFLSPGLLALIASAWRRSSLQNRAS
jgi:hypothetical protein